MVTSIAVPFGMQAGGRRTFYDVGTAVRDVATYGQLAVREEPIEIRDPMPAADSSSDSSNDGPVIVTESTSGLDTHTGATIDKRKKKKKVKVQKIKSVTSDGERTSSWELGGSWGRSWWL
ncbi:hypothetical protein QFC20_004392 [Naganishia adeliensis]|uniref:Uncharacterized protein n=1 Tax=Naganishia adeliensis TaxID=92952 RepID=A0ACC2W1V5_9TREE|nr:hypothetical protein QFC20_004392 [Naganishia adeliensis]